MKNFVVANQKGGVGKSSLSVQTTHRAVERKIRVLLVDFDSQANTSRTFLPQGYDLEDRSKLKASMLFSGEAVNLPNEHINEFLSVIPADPDLLRIEESTVDVLRNPRAALARLAADYDICIIDTPPALGKILGGALTAANLVISPLPIGRFEMEGLDKLIKTIVAIKGKYNRAMRFGGVLLMKTNNRSEEEKNAIASLREQHGKIILPDTLPERAAAKKAIAEGVPVWYRTRGESHRRAAIEWKTTCDMIIDGVINA